MISYLSGEIIKRDKGFVVLLVSGVGYRVFLSEKNIIHLSGAKTVDVFCYTKITKDSWNIYGVLSEQELEFFHFLIKISGIGPKAALEASSIGSLEEIETGIRDNSTDIIDSLFVLGKKKAQAIIFEFSRKIKNKSKKISEGTGEVMDAMVKLGFKKNEVREAILDLPESLSVKEKIEEVLKSFQVNKK